MSKNFSALFLMCFMFVSSASASYYDVSQGGTSAEDASMITSVSDLKLLRDRVNSGIEETGKYYKLTKNLDLTSEKNWTPIGLKDENANLNDVSLSPSQKFYGHFDGDGHNSDR